MMPETTTDDALFAGALRLRQPARGHRIGTDAVLLAAAAPVAARQICDLGCGVGAIGLRVAQKLPEAEVRLIDSDSGILELAAMNIRSNGLDGRCHIVAGDILARGFPDAATGLAGWADAVLTNPPFADPGRARPSPVDRKARAHVLTGALDGWIKGALACLRPKGDLIMIHRADALGALMAAMDRRFGNLRLRFIHPRDGMPAHRLLLKATVGSRAPLTVLPPLVLHMSGAAFTPEADALHRGEARLDW